MDEQKENRYFDANNRSVLSNRSNEIDYDAMRLFLLSLEDSFADLNLTPPDYHKLWEERKARNEQVIEAVAHGGHKSKKSTATAETIPLEDRAAVCIQRHVRAFLARKLYLVLLQEKFEKDEEARRQKQLEQVEEGELLVENYLLQRELQDDLVVVKNADRRLVYAASVIQHVWRKYWSKKIDDITNDIT